jgi:cellulose synthase/poly-beta-1,6-N-acetylglucosamine synthase-like glycosyltransferase
VSDVQHTLVMLAFWCSILLVVYAHLGFPLLVALVASFKREHVRKAPVEPHISVVIAAHNEENAICSTLDSVLEQDYPRELLDLTVVSDGSTDQTEELVAGYHGRRVQLKRVVHRGKARAVDAGIHGSNGDIVVLIDANTMLDPGCLRALVANFADERIGGVCGNQRYLRRGVEESASVGEELYWQLDRFLKRMESMTGSVVSADGALYAIRRELYDGSEAGRWTDDFFISTGVVAAGRRLVFEPKARAVEAVAERSVEELQRKVRIISMGLRTVWRRRALMDPFRHGFYALVLVSHKLLRRLASLGLLVAALTALALHDVGAIYALCAYMATLIVALAAVGMVLRKRPIGRWKVFAIPFYFVLANCAAILALFQIVRGRRYETWSQARSSVPRAGSRIPADKE